MKAKGIGIKSRVRSKKGMELVQVAILVALAVALGLIFKTEITDFALLKEFHQLLISHLFTHILFSFYR